MQEVYVKTEPKVRRKKKIILVHHEDCEFLAKLRRNLRNQEDLSKIIEHLLTCDDVAIAKEKIVCYASQLFLVITSDDVWASALSDIILSIPTMGARLYKGNDVDELIAIIRQEIF